MDVLQLIKEDHDNIRRLIAALDTAGKVARKTLANSLSRDIQIHLHLEREYLYPEVSGLFPEGEVMVRLSLANHGEILKILKNVETAAGKSPSVQKNFATYLDSLKAKVEGHFKMEEDNFMPKIRHLISTEDREDLGQVFIEVKDEMAVSFGENSGVMKNKELGMVAQ